MFITHDVEAHEVNEEAFFTKGTYGGTAASSGLVLANEIIGERFHPSAWNVYAVHLSDGDNFDSDNGRYLEEHSKLEDMTQLFGYVELEPEKSYMQENKLSKILKPRIRENSRCITIKSKDDVWPAFRELLNASKGEQ